MKDEQVLSFEFAGNRYDCESKFGFLLADVEYGLLHQEINAEFAAYQNNASARSNAKTTEWRLHAIPLLPTIDDFVNQQCAHNQRRACDSFHRQRFMVDTIAQQ